MDTFSIIIIILALPTILGLIIALRKEKARVEELHNQLEGFKGQTDDEMYVRGKFSELGLMSAGITHEISNPLSIIMGRLSILLQRGDFSGPKGKEMKDGLEQIKRNAERIATIIQSVRQYIYRNEDTDEDFISLKEIIDDVLVFYGQRLKNHGIELRLKNIDKVYVSGHKGQYEQVFLNLISNSFDAIDNLPEKWIEISAVKTDDNIQIFVKDSGHGIPVEVQSRMLEPFYSTKKGKGSGLGLSLVKGIARKHGGDFKYLQDEPNTTFMLELPKASSLNYHH